MAASGSSTWRAAATSSCRLDWLRCKAGGGGDASTRRLSRDSLWPVRLRRPSAFVARNRRRSAASAIETPRRRRQAPRQRRSCTSFWSSSPRAWRIVATMTSVRRSSSASSSRGRSTAVGSSRFRRARRALHAVREPKMVVGVPLAVVDDLAPEPRDLCGNPSVVRAVKNNWAPG